MDNESKIQPKIVPERKDVQNKSIETYAEDMAKVIENNEGGLIKRIIHEQEEAELEKKNLSPKSRKNKIFMLISVLLMSVAVGLIVFFGVFSKQINTIEIAPQYQPPVFVDQNYYKDISDLAIEQITQSVLNEVKNTEVKKGGIEAVYLTRNDQPIGLRKFLQSIGANLDTARVPYMDDNFLMGAFNSSLQKDFFILLKMRSFADVFEGLRSWEGKMFSDLHGFFGVEISADTQYLLTKNFEDGIVYNKNARILKDTNGTAVMMYVFADDTSVVFTKSEDTVREIITRLAAGEVKK